MIKKMFLGTLALSFLVSPSVSFAQSFYGGNEYMDRPVTAPPPSMKEFTHLLPPPPPPSSFANAWQRDGYRRGDVNSPWSSPVYGHYENPRLIRGFEGWNEPNFIPYGNIIQSSNGYNSTGTSVNSKACIDGQCISGN